MPWSEALAGLLMGFFGSVPVAGPVALVVLSKGLDGDTSGGRHVALGAGLGEGLLAGAVFAGMGLFVAGSPTFASALHWVGVGVLVGVGAWFSIRGLASPADAHEGRADEPDQALRGVLLGAGMVLGNPGMLGTWGGAVAALEGTGLVVSKVQTAAIFGAGVSIGVVAWFWAMLAVLQRWRGLMNGKFMDAVVRGIGVALVLMGIYAGLRVPGS